MSSKPTWKPHTEHGSLSEKERDELPESVFAFPKQRKEPLTEAEIAAVRAWIALMHFVGYEAKRYEGKIKGGNVLISTHAETSDARKRVEAIYKAAHAEDICSTSEAGVPRAMESQPSA